VREVRIFDSDQEVAAEAAEFLVWLGEQGIQERGRFRLALSGGSTPKRLYRVLASEYARRLKWVQVEFYFSDERCIPPHHEESNFRMADETLLGPLAIAAEQVCRVRGEDEPEKAAAAYESVIRERFKIGHEEQPMFDLVLLGLGDDGHTASLFPGSPSIREATRLVMASQSPRGVRDRVTFTPPLINHARTVMFLVAGAGKAAAVRTVLEDKTIDPMQCPAKVIQPVNGRLVWFLDQRAAAQLSATKQQIEFDEE
jgi:6-phosphogluconolactonase